MDQIIKCGTKTGSVSIPASKSYAHRLLIAAALGNSACEIECPGISKDISATIGCLNALGGRIEVFSDIIKVSPINRARAEQAPRLSTTPGTLPGASFGTLPVATSGTLPGASSGTLPGTPLVLPCGESGSTLRFLIPIAGALGKKCLFKTEGKLAERPIAELEKALSAHGMSFSHEGSAIMCEGQLTPGEFEIPGNVSSQYISGLLLALPLLHGDSRIRITGRTESAAYINMTVRTLEKAGIRAEKTPDGFAVFGNGAYLIDEHTKVEKDWSNAAFFICMGALSKGGITLPGMDPESAQGDRRVIDIVKSFGAQVTVSGDSITVNGGALSSSGVIDASGIPDLVPTIAALASLSKGKTEIVNAARLRLKESDRLATTSAMLRNLGAGIYEKDDGLVIVGKEKLKGGEAETFNDHRIAMAAAVAACGCENDVIVKGAECTAKSYPLFFEHYENLVPEETK